MPNTSHVVVRKASNKHAVVLVHGFGGEATKTFGLLPAFLAGEPRLERWDIHCFGYPTSLAPDVSGVWAADPDLTELGGLLESACRTHFEDYDKLALVAHSMGGLVVERALVAGKLRDRASHVVLFGTPSNGLRKAGPGEAVQEAGPGHDRWKRVHHQVEGGVEPAVRPWDAVRVSHGGRGAG